MKKPSSSKIGIAVVSLYLLCGCAAQTPSVQLLSAEQICSKSIQANWDQAPRIVHWAKPNYPEIAIRAKVEGQVGVLVSLDSLGGISKVEICEGLSPMLNKSAIEAARKCRFLPATKNGEPVSSTIIIPSGFSLK